MSFIYNIKTTIADFFSGLRLVDNASKWFRMFSVQALLFIGVIQSIAFALPTSVMMGRVPFLSDFTWADLNAALTVAAVVLGALGRLVKQDSVSR